MTLADAQGLSMPPVVTPQSKANRDTEDEQATKVHSSQYIAVFAGAVNSAERH